MTNNMDPLMNISASKQNSIENARRFFQRVSKDGKLYSKCLIKDCHRVLSGVQKFNLERHLAQIHSIELETSQNAGKICRLCFKNKSRFVNVFSTAMDVVRTIQTHFPCDEVDENDLLPKHVCLQCWNQLSKFHDFYVAVNEARIVYLASNVKIEDTAIISDANIGSFGFAANTSDDDELVVKMEGNDPFIGDSVINYFEGNRDGSELPVADSPQSQVHPSEMEDLNEKNSYDGELIVQPLPASARREMTGCRKHFQRVAKNGKLYSKCLIECCSRILAGDLRFNLERHLKVKHQMNPPFNILPPKATETCPRKNNVFFKDVKIGRKWFSKCLIANCHRLLPDRRKFNLEKHLKVRHKINRTIVLPSVASNSKNPNAVIARRQEIDSNENKNEHLSANVSSSSDTPNSHDAFSKLVKRKGELYSKCVVDNCNRLFSGKNDNLLNIHLRVSHQIKQPSSAPSISTTAPKNVCTTSNARKYFKCSEENGKVYSKCLIKDCNRTLSGNLKSNLERHLVKVHGNNVNSSTESMDDTSQADLTSESNSNGVYIYYNSDSLNGSFFEDVSKDGKSYYKCTMENCHRILSREIPLLRRHLNVIHKTEDLSEQSNAREHFQRVTENGHLYSKCLVENCGRMIAGGQKFNLERHLKLIHKKF